MKFSGIKNMENTCLLKVFISTEHYSNEQILSHTEFTKNEKIYIYPRNSGSAWLEETNGVPKWRLGQQLWRLEFGAKIVALSQEIPNWAELVLPIS